MSIAYITNTSTHLPSTPHPTAINLSEMAWNSSNSQVLQEGNISKSPMPNPRGGNAELEITPPKISLLLEPQFQTTVPHSGRQSIPMRHPLYVQDKNPRAVSPESILQFPQFLIKRNLPDPVENAESEKRVTIWNFKEKRKLSGNSAPFKRNLEEYLRKHPDWQEYVGQDKDTNGKRLMPKKRRNPSSTPQPTPTKAPTTPAEQITDFLPDESETCEPVPLYIRPVECAMEVRAQQLDVKRKLYESEEAAHRAEEQKLREMEKQRLMEVLALVSKRRHQRAKDWKYAQDEAQRVRNERAVALQHERQKWLIKDEQQQQAVITQSSNRVSLWKRARLV